MMQTSPSTPLDISFRAQPEKLAAERNIAELMDRDDRRMIGLWALQGYRDDKQSREKWESWYAEAIKLALQVKEAKTFPWPGCSNVRFPLLTIAALNAHAQAYPALISGDMVAKCRVIGDDPSSEKSKRAQRVGAHMSYQLLETMPWEEQTDKQLLVHYIMGTTFKKTYRDNARRVNCSDLVMPQDLVINYFTKDMDTCPRASHWFTLTKNEVTEKVQAGVYLEPDVSTRPGQDRPTGPLEAAKDKAQLIQPTANLGIVNYIIEQSTWLDLDGDGYDEPYAITFDEQTGFIYRIHARFYKKGVLRGTSGKYKDKVIRIDVENYYTKYELIPSPDGGAYGLGLGRFLAPINDAVDTLINQMLDSNTMSLLGGGFSTRGVRMKAGDSTFKPYEYKPVDMTGDDIRKNILPIPKNEISGAAFQLLQYLVEYGERIGSSGDIQMGQIKGYEKTGTMQIANENGKLIFNATFKRFWRGMKEEFKKLYKLNSLFIEEGGEVFRIGEKEYQITPADYSIPSSGIVPAADPNIVSRTERRMTAMLVMETGMKVGWAGHNQEAVMRRFYEANDVQGIPEIYPGLEKSPPPPNFKMIEAQAKQAREQIRGMDMKNKNMIAVASLQIKAKESMAKIMQMLANAEKLAKQANSLETEHAIQLLEVQMKAETEKRDDILQTIKLLFDAIKEDHGPEGAGSSNPMGAMAAVAGDKEVSPVSAAA